ncbi:MAG: Oligopeptide transport ATP-binding protein OppF [Chlamydiales bacterium]|nr:Oligopeptide transport ATP-binding protein OppF [Chlamydiales bacterium]MCH9635233.1 Oligopeptide transport ATP-binding protein OppF [Chlamydiales bacterium]
MKEPLLKVRNLRKEFKVGSRKLVALDDFSLNIYPGETVGLVGESGCGKSTVGRCLLQLYKPTKGSVSFDQVELTSLDRKDLKQMRRKMQMVFQDPYASLNPRMTVQDIIGEAIDIHKLAKGPIRTHRVEQLLNLVGLNKSHASRFPHEFSGGQRQRIGIARALAVEPNFLVCDEPLSALDVSVQAQVVNLLKRLQKQMGLTYLFIAHDLSLIKYISDRVAVMYLGQLMELGKTEELYKTPLHPYTKALLSSIPIPDPEVEKRRNRVVLKSELPNPMEPPVGCPFCTRCSEAKPICFKVKPKWKEAESNRFVACHLF